MPLEGSLPEEGWRLQFVDGAEVDEGDRHSYCVEVGVGCGGGTNRGLLGLGWVAWVAGGVVLVAGAVLRFWLRGWS